MTVLKTFVTAAFVITSAGAMAETTYPTEHMNDTVDARNAVTARPTPVAPAAAADPLYRSDDYPNDTGWHRAAEAQQARGGNPEQAWAEITQRPSPIAPAAPADPDFVPFHVN